MSVAENKPAKPVRMSREDVAALQAAILQNVSNLADAARSLLEIGRHEQAYALAEAAAEEMGKYMLVIRVGIEVTFGGGRTDWTRFWGKFHDHGVKAWNAALADYLVADRLEDWARGNVEAISADTAGLEQARYQAAVMVELRERALYVDFRKGRVRRPAEQISRDHAAMMLQAVAGLLERFNELGIVADAARLKAMASDKELRARAQALRKLVNRIRS
jgi:AbiV family abortive infection protein